MYPPWVIPTNFKRPYNQLHYSRPIPDDFLKVLVFTRNGFEIRHLILVQKSTVIQNVFFLGKVSVYSNYSKMTYQYFTCNHMISMVFNIVNFLIGSQIT